MADLQGSLKMLMEEHPDVVDEVRRMCGGGLLTYDTLTSLWPQAVRNLRDQREPHPTETPPYKQGEPMPGKFNFTIFGGLDKQFYLRFRALREKYKLDDRGLVECMIWYVVLYAHLPDLYEPNFAEVCKNYQATAPVDITLPEVV